VSKRKMGMIKDKLEDILDLLEYVAVKSGEMQDMRYVENLDFAYQHIEIAIQKIRDGEDA
jgi:hypothetical protein